ncbi:hypothetical protein EH291_17375 [Vibrio cholerae]|nr:hypothetical protein [Vibrio cholerae]
MEYVVNKKELFNKLLAYIFPEFTNKVTWFVIISGVALLSSSFIEEILRALINENFNLKLTDGNDSVIGAVIIGFGLLHNYGYVREKNKVPYDVVAHEKLKRDLEHDTKLFNKINSWIPEGNFKGFIEHVLANHSYVSHLENPRDYFYYDGDKSDNNFVNEELNSLKQALHGSFMKFEDFKAVHFFVHGPARSDDSLYLCMHPEWNTDRGGYPSSEEDKRYGELTSELNSLGRDVIKKYDEYRLAIKRVLSI